MQLHGEKRFKCKYCDLAFAQSAGRRGHEIRVHNVNWLDGIQTFSMRLYMYIKNYLQCKRTRIAKKIRFKYIRQYKQQFLEF